MMLVAFSLVNMITDGQKIVGFTDWFMMLMIDCHFGVPTTVALLLVVVVIPGCSYTAAQEAAPYYAVGGNPEVACLVGINGPLVTSRVYVACTVLAGLAGIVLAVRLNSVQPSSSFGYELDTIVAVESGGILISVLRNGLNLLNVSPSLQRVIIGVVIVLAVGAETLCCRRR